MRVFLFLSLVAFVSCVATGGNAAPGQTATQQTIFDHVKSENITGIQAFLKSGGDVDLKDVRGWPLIQIAVEQGKTESLRVLVEYKADVNATDPSKRTALMKASFYGYDDMVKILLDAGADYKLRDDGGETSLRKAMYQNHSAIQALLRGAGAAQ